MKRILKYIFALTTGLGMAFNAFAGDDDIVLGKQISAPDANGLYTITLDAFVTGQSQTTHSESIAPCDIILVLDLSSSMTSTKNNVTVTSKGSKVATGTELNVTKTYIIVIDGKEYYIKGFMDDNGWNARPRYTYNYRYSETVPTTKTDGLGLGSQNMTSQYKVSAEDEIYEYNNESVTRLEALKRASQQFVQTVYDNSPEGGSHKVSIVGFNYSGGLIAGCTDANPFYEVTESNVSSIISRIGNIETTDLGTEEYPSSAQNYSTNSRYQYARNKFTNPASGLYKAANVLETVKNDGRSKVVVFFTDGEPCAGGTDTFSDKYARTAVNMAYVIKQPTDKSFTQWTYTDPEPKNPGAGASYTTGYGAKVYSVAILSSESNKTRRFLHYVSSNYPDQKLNDSYTFPTNNNGNGGEAPHDYYQLSNGSNLSTIFQKIADDSSQGTASVSLDAENSRIVDIMSDNFQIPTNASDITVHVEEFYGNSMAEAKITDRTNEDYSDIWKTDSDYSPAPSYELYSSKNDGVNDAIRITGFDFSKDDGKTNGVTDWNSDGSLKTPGNWVGPRTNKSNVTTWYGRKIVIQFKVKINPDYSPGYGVPSNDIKSGIEKLEDGEWKPVEKFPVPTVDRPGLCIMKEGLAVGESSIFSVSAGSNTYNVVLTQKANKNGTKLPCYIILKGLPEGTYSVTETSWSWTYSTTPSTKVITQTIKGLTEEEVSTIKNTIVNGTTTVSNNEVVIGKSTGEGTTSSPKYAILKDEFGLVSTYGTVVLLYQFSNAKNGSNPANAEARINNKFTGGTNTSEPEVEDGTDDGDVDL